MFSRLRNFDEKYCLDSLCSFILWQLLMFYKNNVKLFLGENFNVEDSK